MLIGCQIRLMEIFPLVCWRCLCSLGLLYLGILKLLLNFLLLFDVEGLDTKKILRGLNQPAKFSGNLEAKKSDLSDGSYLYSGEFWAGELLGVLISGFIFELGIFVFFLKL